MKKLIYKSGIYYLTDDSSNPKGKTNVLTYKATSSLMPHHYFKEYIVVYGRPTCPYCIKTFQLLKKKKKQFIFVEIDTQPSELFFKSNLLTILSSEIKGQTTVPIVFDKSKFIGGASESESYF
jgi:glutaredoxin